MRYILLLIFIIPVAAFSQTSILQDAKGEAAFKAFGNQISVNAQDKSFATSFNTLRRSIGNSDSTISKFERLGINLKLNSNEGVANLKNSKGVLIDGELGVYFGRKTTLKPDHRNPNHEGWSSEWYGAFNISVDRNKFFDINNIPEKITSNQGHLGWKMEAGNYGYKGNLLYGFGANLGQSTNIDDLKANTVHTLITSSASDSVRVFKEEKAFDRSKFNSHQFFTRFNMDLAWLLNRKKTADISSEIPPVFASFHFRSNYVDDSFDISPALGFYIGKPGAPRDIVAGISFQVLNLLNSKKQDNNAWNRSVLNLTAGFKI